jgi:hypothetical protein
LHDRKGPVHLDRAFPLVSALLDEQLLQED